MISSSADSSEQLTKYNEDLRKKEKELDEAREEIFQTKKTLKLTEGKLSNIEQDLKSNTELVEQLRSEKANLELGIDDAKKSNMDYAEKIRKYEQNESELLSKVNDGERIKENLVEKSREVDSFSKQLIKKEQEIVNLHSQYETLQNSRKEETSLLRKEISDLSAELSTSQDEIKNLQKSKSKLEADQSANRWSIEELTEKLNVQLNEMSKLENLIVEKDLKLDDKENKLSELHAINEALIIDKEMSDKNLTASLNSMTNTIEELRTKLKNTEDMVKDKTIEVSKAREKAEKSDALITELNAMIASMQHEHACISAELRDARKTIMTQVKAAEDVQVERAKAEQQSRNEEIKQKQNDLSGANKRIHELQYTVNALEKKLRDQETKSADLIKTMECNEQEVDKNVQNLQEKLNIAKVEETRLLDELNRL